MFKAWPNLRRRELVGELMDDPALAADEHRRALGALRRINTISRTAETLFSRLSRLMAGAPGRHRRVLDIACGDGANTLRLAELARRGGLGWEVSGCDISPRAVEAACQRAARRRMGVSFFRADALDGLSVEGYDAVVNSLFLHHLTDDQAAALLGRLGEARHVVVSDLARGCLAYSATWAGVRVLSRSGVVHVDGPLSVRAAFTPAELVSLARGAGLGGAVVQRVWPMRQLLVWSRG